ncbi:MAG: AAA family ATPase [Bacteroidota bacterium]
MQLFLISGPPGSGKSLTLQVLLQQGYPLLTDSYRILIEEQLGQDPPQLPWTQPRNFAHLCQGRMWKDYQKLRFRRQYFFGERGIPDLMALMDQEKIEIPEILKNILVKIPYQKKVFFCPHWPQIYQSRPQRPYQAPEAAAFEELLRKRYLALGFELIELPLASAEVRAQCILEDIQPEDIQPE